MSLDEKILKYAEESCVRLMAHNEKIFRISRLRDVHFSFTETHLAFRAILRKYRSGKNLLTLLRETCPVSIIATIGINDGRNCPASEKVEEYLKYEGLLLDQQRAKEEDILAGAFAVQARLEGFEKALEDLNKRHMRLGGSKHKYTTLEEQMKTAYGETFKPIRSFPTVSPFLDEKLSIGGYPYGKGLYTMIGMASNVGKTSWALDNCIKGAKAGYDTILCSLEDSALSLGYRGLCNKGGAGVPAERIFRHDLKESDHKIIKEVMNEGWMKKIHLPEESPYRPKDLIKGITPILELNPVKAIFIDFIQRFKCRKNEDKSSAIERSIDTILNFMKHYPEVAVIFFSQLSIKKEFLEPGMGDFFWTSEAVQYCDLGIAAWKPKLANWDYAESDMLALNVFKQKNGTPFRTALQRIGNHFTFHGENPGEIKMFLMTLSEFLENGGKNVKNSRKNNEVSGNRKNLQVIPK